MSQLILAPSLFCHQCGAACEGDDNFCRRCGIPVRDQEEKAVAGQAAAVVIPEANQIAAAPVHPISSARQLLDNRLFVVTLLLIVGPLGLPALWFNRRFSSLTKIFTTVVYFLLTAVLPLALAWYWLEIAVRPLVDSFSEVNGAR